MISKKDFPLFNLHPDLIYLDAAATTQKPAESIVVSQKWYEDQNANVRRGLYDISVQATTKYEQARQTIAALFNVKDNETIFVKNATEGLNLLAYGISCLVKPDSNIVVSDLEHHSNLLPWMRLAKDKNIELRYLKSLDGYIDAMSAGNIIDEKTIAVAITHGSNVLGTIQPIKEIAKIAHEKKALVFIDGSQVVPHLVVRPWQLGADAYIFSGHKAYGLNGGAIAFVKAEVARALEPLLVGGEMVAYVNKDNAVYLESPYKFEAGTPDAGAFMSLVEALTWLNKNRLSIHQNEIKLIQDMRQILVENEVIIHTPESAELPILSFSIPKVHPHDIASLFNEHSIAVRAGYCCAEPLVKSLNEQGVVRVSLGAWNDERDILAFKNAMSAIKKQLA